jgi:hypothetical protein
MIMDEFYSMKDHRYKVFFGLFLVHVYSELERTLLYSEGSLFLKIIL